MATKKMTNKEKIEVLQKQVWKEVCEFMERPEDMLEYLNFLQKFPQYSIHNRMLIHSQRPGALLLTSLKKLGLRFVKVKKHYGSLLLLLISISTAIMVKSVL